MDQALEAFKDVELVETVDVFTDTADKVRTAQLPLDSLVSEAWHVFGHW